MGRHAEQTTLARPVSKAGIGLRSGETCAVSLLPANRDTGILFATEGGLSIPATADFVLDTRRGTTLGKGQVSIGSVEHLMAALYGVGVDNARVEVTGPELPACDGSAAEWVALLKEAGLARLGARRDVMRLPREVWGVDGEGWAVASPTGNGLSLVVAVEYENTVAGCQRLWVRLTRSRFERELAPARTFALAEEVASLRRQGLARGADESNAFTVGPEGYSGPLRFDDEVVRHKALDLLGDLALCGRPIHAHVVAVRPGHSVNVMLAQALRATFRGNKDVGQC